jgi:hypothetical protein
VALAKLGASYNYLFLTATMAVWAIARAVSGDDRRPRSGAAPARWPEAWAPRRIPGWMAAAAIVLVTWPAVMIGRGRLAEAKFPTADELAVRAETAGDLVATMRAIAPAAPLLVVTDDPDVAWALGIPVSPPDSLLTSLASAGGGSGGSRHPFADAPDDAWIVSRHLLPWSTTDRRTDRSPPPVTTYYGAPFHQPEAAVEAWRGREMVLARDNRLVLAPLRPLHEPPPLRGSAASIAATDPAAAPINRD